MAVQEQTPYIEYVGNGTTKVFPLNFDCEDQEHLIVTINGDEPIFGSWLLIDGAVSFKTAPLGDSKIIFQRNSPFERTANYSTYNNSFRPEPVNKDFDRIWWKLQEMGLANWLLGLRIDKEIRDRIAADIYYYTLVTKETDQKVGELKEYIDNLVNNITGNEFLPILDKFIKTWSGRTQEQENKAFVTSVYDYAELVTLKGFDGRVAYVKKDGISGEFVFIADSTTLDPDGALVIAAASGGQWLRITELGGCKASWFEPHANGIDNDDSVFNRIALSTNIPIDTLIDMSGKTYLVSKYPARLKTTNGYFKNIASGTTQKAYYQMPTNGHGTVALGDGALAAYPATLYPDMPNVSIVAIGYNTMNKLKQGRGSVAIGSGCMSESLNTFDNIAIGADALKNVQSASMWYVSNREGTRNIAIGGNAAHFITAGAENTAIGRNALHGCTSGVKNTVLGSSALGGYNVVGTTGHLENFMPYDGHETTALGVASLANYMGTGGLVAVGAYAARNIKKASSGVVIGFQALNNAESDISKKGTSVIWSGSDSCTYAQVGSSVTLTVSNTRGAVVGGYATFSLVSGDIVTEPIIHKITGVTSKSIVVEVTASRTTSGNCLLTGIDGASQVGVKVNNFTMVGDGASQSLVAGVEVVSVGNKNLASSKESNLTTSVGSQAGGGAEAVTECTLIGRSAGGLLSGTLHRCTAIGNQSLNQYADGSPITNLNTSVALGFSARVSGDNQVQIGGSTTTTYVYGTVQNRSDLRDKADVRDTVLGLEFVNSLRPVDYKWDMREDYVNELFPIIKAIAEPKYPEEPKSPIADDFITVYEDGMSINRTDLYEAALLKYSVDIEAYNKDVTSMRAEYDAHLAIYTIEEQKRSAAVRAWSENPTRDGSKIRNRYHHGFIAQEVQALNVDFGGLQDHTVNGGCDVLSIGYDEMIAPLVKAVQELTMRIKDLESK